MHTIICSLITSCSTMNEEILKQLFNEVIKIKKGFPHQYMRIDVRNKSNTATTLYYFILLYYVTRMERTDTSVKCLAYIIINGI